MASASARPIPLPASRARPTFKNMQALLNKRVDQIYEIVRTGANRRADPASTELLRAARRLLGRRGKGKLRRLYPGGPRYHISLPGDPPARATGDYMKSWSKHMMPGLHGIRQPGITTSMPGLYKWMEFGTTRMLPRPHRQRILAEAWPGIVMLYTQQYVEGSVWTP